MEQRRRIAFATSSRADYGPARWVLADLQARPDVDLVVIATGTHVDAAHGGTLAEIAADGIVDVVQVPVVIGTDDPVDRAAWLADWLVGSTRVLGELRPDLLVLLGDRFETLIAAQAATLVGIPIAHLHGGEKTTGAIDDGIRHAITKLAHIHITAAADYARRVRQMGERTVFSFSAPGLCALDREGPVSPAELEHLIGRPLMSPYVVVTYHPVTAGDPERTLIGAEALIAALTERPDLDVVLTGVNVDPGFEPVSSTLAAFARQAGSRVVMVESLGNRGYLSVLRGAQACIGNSSSGIVEAPALGVPTINIGPRQDGRLRAPSIIDVPEDAGAITDAMRRVADPAFLELCRTRDAPYGRPGASAQIAALLATIDLSGLPHKDFADCTSPACSRAEDA
mgnify:CR=1 FL=1